MDRYQKIKKIGEGSFGKAYLVKSKRDGQQYVIKEINIVRMSKKEREEARKEVALLAQMKHPNIVTYRESFEETGSLYICMDFCEAGDLYGKINSQRGILFSEDQVLDWFVQICFSIKYIHDRKILHRDIKSQNIFLTRNGAVKLGDFGIAKVLNSTVELARTCIGTPYYLSPEICENRPYNNKSDIWSLGCVLYEITTLKHAFEAGNMKNLVFKIVRGSYPPVSSKYSYELRNVIAALFKRNPRDRPSINNLLRKNFLIKKVEKFMGDEVIAKELAHTVMHGQKMAKDMRALPPTPVSRPVSARSVQEKRPESARPTPRYDPAAVYGAPVARKSRDGVARRSGSKDAVRKSADADKKRAAIAVVAASNNEIAKKRRELLEKEKARRQQQKDNEFAAQHKAILDKQKVARINKAREEGWKGLMESLSSNDDTKSSGEGRPKTPQQPVKRNIPSPAFRPLPVGGAAQRMPVNDRGKYDHYNDFLDKLAAERGDRQRDPAPKNYMNAGEGPQMAAQQGHQDQQLGAKAAERARVVEEYMNRKKEAAYYKQRGQAQVQGVQQRPDSARRAVGDVKPGKREWAEIDAKNEEEKEYLARLKQIRLQNFNQRRNIKQDGVAKQGIGVKGALNAADEQRKKKIEALKAQADERASKLKAQLELKRREAYEKEKYACERGRDFEQKPLFPVDPPKRVEAPPAISITQAMSAIGGKPQVENSKNRVEPAPVIPITQAMAAIGARKQVDSSINKSPLQQKKDAELRRINERSRPKWGNQDENAAFLANMELEETASGMEATSVRDSVIVGGGESKPKDERKRWGEREVLINKDDSDPDVLPSARRQWGGMHESLMNKLSEADIQATMTLVKKEQESSVVPGVGETIVITTQPPTPKAHGTITLSKEDTKSKKPLPSPEKPSTKLKTSLKKESPVTLDGKGPTEVNASQGGKLFDKVELEEEDEPTVDDMTVEDYEEEEINPSYQKTISGMKLGLTIGHFDLRNSKMLRTCSLPDLSKLFKTIDDKPDDVAHIRFSLDLPSSPRSQGDDDDGDDDGDEDGEGEDGEDEGSDSDVDSDEVDEDLASVMATMERLLLDEDRPNSQGDNEENGDLKGSGSDSSNEADNDRDSATTTGDSSIINTIVAGEEEWCNSDDDEDGNNSDRDREEEDMFSRLEATRAQLEAELGCDRFLDVYKAVQAAHEDEDETIESGEKIALGILGDKGHLYNKILQLVMADGAYIEDND